MSMDGDRGEKEKEEREKGERRKGRERERRRKGEGRKGEGERRKGREGKVERTFFHTVNHYLKLRPATFDLFSLFLEFRIKTIVIFFVGGKSLLHDFHELRKRHHIIEEKTINCRIA